MLKASNLKSKLMEFAGFFRSRTKKADKKYFMKGEEILKKICFRSRNRFIDDVKHDIGKVLDYLHLL